jgi:hypothetical protein
MGLRWEELEAGLLAMRDYVRSQPLWHSIAHDSPITPGFLGDLRRRLDKAYAHR